MKKLLTLTALLALTSTSSFAAASGTLFLQGIVAQKLSITVTPVSVASALILETSQTDLKVGSVVEQSNSSNGYKVTITSANKGKLLRSGGTEVFPYTLKYGGSSVGLSGSGTTIVNPAVAAVTAAKDLNISYAGVAAESMIEGTYTDTLTLTIAIN